MEEEKKLKIPKEVADYLRQNATSVVVGDDDFAYYHLPYWFKMDKEGDIVVQYFKNEIPIELRDLLKRFEYEG